MQRIELRSIQREHHVTRLSLRHLMSIVLLITDDTAILIQAYCRKHGRGVCFLTLLSLLSFYMGNNASSSRYINYYTRCALRWHI